MSFLRKLKSMFCRKNDAPDTPKALTSAFTQSLDATLSSKTDELGSLIQDSRRSLEEKIEGQSQALRSLRKSTLLFDEGKAELLAAATTLQNAASSLAQPAMEIAEHFRTWAAASRVYPIWATYQDALLSRNASSNETLQDFVMILEEHRRNSTFVNRVLETHNLAIPDSLFVDFNPQNHECVEVEYCSQRFLETLRGELIRHHLLASESLSADLVIGEIQCGTEFHRDNRWKTKRHARVKVLCIKEEDDLTNGKTTEENDFLSEPSL